MSFSLDDMLDFDDESDSPILSDNARNAVLREYSAVQPTNFRTTASENGYANQQTSITSIAALLQNIPSFKSHTTTTQQQDILVSNLLGTAIAGTDSLQLGGGFDDIVPSDIKAKVKAIGKIDIAGIISGVSSSSVSGGASSDTGGAAGASGLENANARAIYTHLTTTGGFNMIQACGIMGNIQAESGFDPGIEEISGGGGYGLCQWTASRRTNLSNYAQSVGKPVNDINMQLDFLMSELNGAYKTNTLDPIRATNDLAECVYIFLEKFERPADIPGQKPVRLRMATALHDAVKVGGGSVSASGGGGNATGGQGSTGTSVSTSSMRTAWAPACTGPWATFNLHGGGKISVRAAILPAVEALNKALIVYGYRTRKGDTGAYNCRKITGGSGWSLHAFGIAIDINWSTNPYGAALVTDMPNNMVQAIKKIKTKNGMQVWRWGGDYKNNKDAMHYEIICTPADLATGLDPKTIPNSWGG